MNSGQTPVFCVWPPEAARLTIKGNYWSQLHLHKHLPFLTNSCLFPLDLEVLWLSLVHL